MEKRKREEFKFIAYKGNSISAPGNSAPAISQALDHNVDGIYLDLMYTLDEKMICWEDPASNCDFNNKKIRLQKKLDDIKKIDLGDIYDKKFTGERILTLEEVIDMIKGKTDLYLALSAGSRRYPNIEERVLDCLEEKGMMESTIILSFDHMALKWIKKINSTVNTFAMYHCRPAKPIDFALDIMADGVACYYYLLTSFVVEAAKREYLDVLCYAPDSAEAINEMLNIGVDGIISPDSKLIQSYTEKKM